MQEIYSAGLTGFNKHEKKRLYIEHEYYPTK